MSIKVYAAALFAAGMGTFAHASDNTITFQGEVATETCSVVVNGLDAAPVVLLPTVSVAELNTKGMTAGATRFDIGVVGCTGSPAGTRISTVFVGNNVVPDTGNLANTGSAQQVEVQILDTKDMPVKLNGRYVADGDLSLDADETQKTATYSAQYFATGAATVGSVQASMQYAITYQ